MFTVTTAASDYSIIDSTTAKWNRPTAETAPNCPRCASANTKFCYYNNYSLSQPRYFCKSCRRYWTNGGSLRNIPIGGGCRKTRRARASAKPPNRPAEPESAKYVNQSAAAGAEESFNSSDNYNSSNRVDSMSGGDYDHQAMPEMDGQDYALHDFSGFDQLRWSEGTTGFDGAHVQPMMQVQDFELISHDDEFRISSNLAAENDWAQLISPHTSFSPISDF